MRTWTMYLWKEWREQRGALLGLVLVLPLLLAGIVLLRGERLLGAPMFPVTAGAVGMLAGLLVVGTDLLSREVRGARLRFLERLPGGLSAAFLAKLAVFLLVVAGSALYGFGAACLAAVGRGVTPWVVPDAVQLRLVLPCLGFAFFAFAASAWVPRGPLAVPIAALWIGLVGWPGWLFFAHVPDVGLAPIDFSWFSWEPWAFSGLCLTAALASAWASFVRGRSHGGGTRRAAAWGLGVAALLMSPSWAWAGLRITKLFTIDPGSGDFRIQQAWLGEGGRTVFANACRAVPSSWEKRNAAPVHALVIDLPTGEWRRVAEVGSRLLPGQHAGPPHLDVPPSFPWAPSFATQPPRRGAGAPFFLGSTGVETASFPEGAARRFARVPAEALPPGCHVLGWAGLGYRLARPAGYWVTEGYYDPFRGRYYSVEERGDGLAGDEVLVRPGLWLVRETHAWRAVDPETGSARELFTLSRDERLGPILGDGRVFLIRGGVPWLFDPDSGAWTPITRSGADDRLLSWIHTPWGGPVDELDPPLVRLGGPGYHAVARLDLEPPTLQLAEASMANDIVGCPDHDSVLLLEENRRIVQRWFGSDRREVLFPRGQ